MKLFGTLKSFDVVQGIGSIKPETGGDDIRFENSAIQWNRAKSPQTDQRLSYELGTSKDGQPRALNLHTV